MLMDARVLGRVWPGQIMGQDLQMEEWSADTAPDVGALQQLLSNLDYQRALWSQIRTFSWGGSRGQREKRDASPRTPGVTEAEGEGYLEPAASRNHQPGDMGVTPTRSPALAPWHLGEAGRGSAGPRRRMSAASETRAVAPGVPPGAAPGVLESVERGDLRRGPRPPKGGRQPAAREEGATAPPRGATESGGGREQVNPPLVEGPPREGKGLYGRNIDF